ncbi:MAG: glycosyltransferase family 2 protein [Phycisphaerales bacterium]
MITAPKPRTPNPGTRTLHLSVLIPTLNRPGHLTRCLERLRAQTETAGAFEVIVIHDGPDPHGIRAAADFDTRQRFDLHAIQAPRLGNAHAKNLGLERARGTITVFLNDDVLPEPDFLETHLRAHTQRDASSPALIVGQSPWCLAPSPTTFDRLLAETSMVFFYDRMLDSSGTPTQPPDHDWGYRHAWTLNLSAPTEAARACGEFDAALANCCFEDVEFAWRFTRKFNAPVLFRPEARADHDHPYTPADYLKREFRLGYSAFGFAIANPPCAQDLFRRDITAPHELAETQAHMNADEPRAAAWRARFAALADPRPADAADLPSLACEKPETPSLAELYQQHLPLKRHEFRKGLLAAARGELIEGLCPHPDSTATQGARLQPSSA